MNILRNIFFVFIVAVAVTIMQSGCTSMAMAKIAMESDPIDTQAQRDACDVGVSEMEEHYHKTTTQIKHTTKTICK